YYVSLRALHSPATSPFFFFTDTATTEIYTLSLHDALPIYCRTETFECEFRKGEFSIVVVSAKEANTPESDYWRSRAYNELALQRSEEHTSELQSRGHLVCRLLLEKKKKNNRKD